MADLFYCKDCMAASPAETCPFCGQTLHLPALEDDLCRLADLGTLESDLLAQLLRDQNIPFHRQSTSGLVSVLGSFTETWRFFVHCANLERARELLGALDVEAEWGGTEWKEENRETGE